MSDVLSLLRGACKLGWITRRSTVAVLLFSLVWEVDQANEYLDNILSVCSGSSNRCVTNFGMRVTPLQFTLLAASVIWFAFLVRDTTLIALQGCFAPRDGRDKSVTGYATVLGTAPLLIFSYGALAATGYIYQDWLLYPALVGVFILGWIVKAALRQASNKTRLLVGSLFVFAIVIASVGSLRPRWAMALLIVAWLLFSSMLLLTVRVAGYGPKYRWLSIVFCVCAGAFLMLRVYVAAIHISDQGNVFGAAIAFLLPLSLLTIPTSISTTDQSLEYARTDAGQFEYWRYFKGLTRRTIGVYGFGLFLIAVALCVAGETPSLAAEYLLAPTTLLLVLSAAGICYVLLTALFGRAVFWCSLLVFVIASWRNVAPPAPLAAPEKAFAHEDCHEPGTVCPMSDRVWDRYQRWSAQPGRGEDTPVILVAAAGGGSRAAAHTASSLAAVDEATCGAFGDHIFAISGVSGGAIGSLLYAASRVDAYGLAERERCRGTKPSERSHPLVNGLLAVATADHLSPVLLRGVTHDLVRGSANAPRIDGSTDLTDFETRAGTLQMSWIHQYQAFLSTLGIGNDRNALLNEDRLRADAQPFLVFNASSVQDGHRVLLSYPLLCPRDGWCAEHMSPLTDATDSARFPLVSPARARNLFHWNPWRREETVSERAIVDGGYFDNSGGQTILDIANALEQHGIAASRIFVLLITSDPDEGLTAQTVPDYAASGWMTQFAAPIRSLVTVRDGRTAIALNDMEQRMGTCHVIHWSMSLGSLNPSLPEQEKSLTVSAAAKAIRELHQGVGSDPFEDVRRAERAPALGWALSARSGNGLSLLAHAHALSFEGGQFRYENELLLASRLHYNNETDQSILDGDLKKSRCSTVANPM